MVLKFPSGRVSVTFQELRKHQVSQPACIICDKRWHWHSHACFREYICILHPCQHLVGSGCWETVPEERKDRCPVCKVKIGCKESVRVSWAHGKVDVESDKKTEEEIEIDRKKEMRMKERRKNGPSPQNVAMILYFVNLRDSWDVSKERIEYCPARGTQALTELCLDRLIFFLRHLGQYKDNWTAQKIGRELRVFNRRHATKYSLVDLGLVVSSPEDLDEILREAEDLKQNVKKFPRVLPQGIGQK